MIVAAQSTTVVQITGDSGQNGGSSYGTIAAKWEGMVRWKVA